MKIMKILQDVHKWFQLFSSNVSIEVIYSFLIIGTQKLGTEADINMHTRNVLPDNPV
jgi:hypothetical protein